MEDTIENFPTGDQIKQHALDRCAAIANEWTQLAEPFLKEEIMDNSFYVEIFCYTHSEQDLNRLVRIDEDLFYRLNGYADSTGSIQDCQEVDLQEVDDFPDVHLSKDEREAIRDDHYLYFEIC